MREGRDQVFYVHVPSCGGTTFWSVLRSVYGANKVVRCVKDEATLAEYNVIENVRASSRSPVIARYPPCPRIRARS